MKFSLKSYLTALITFSSLGLFSQSINTDRPGASNSASVLSSKQINLQFGSAFSRLNNNAGQASNFLGGDVLLRFGLGARLEFNFGYQSNYYDFVASNYIQHVFPVTGLRFQLLEGEAGNLTAMYFFEMPFVINSQTDAVRMQSEQFHEIFVAYGKQLDEELGIASTLKSNLLTKELAISLNATFTWDHFGAFIEAVSLLNNADKAYLFQSSWAANGANIGLFLDINERLRVDSFLNKNFNGSAVVINLGFSANLK